MKRILTIQDVSCVGKCSLTVALPIISAAQVETCVLPTAVLSNHTHEIFHGYTFADLTGEINPIVRQWLISGVTFDAIYTGYLGSFEQMDLIENLIETFRQDDQFVFIDPVLGDAGKLYSGFDKHFAKRMAKFCAKADYIAPNMTEVAALLDREYIPSGYSEEYVCQTLYRLAELGPRVVAITGVEYAKDQYGIVGLDVQANEFFTYFHERIDGSYHGAGDIFSSATVAALARGKSAPEAFKIAADFTLDSIRATLRNPTPRNYGVDFETALPKFIRVFDQ
ncbi:MAG: pyridoxamine kinase [Planctomycetia bacterium]|nr:pyridoxamine kinase [Planctomycetia bacterium]